MVGVVRWMALGLVILGGVSSCGGEQATAAGGPPVALAAPPDKMPACAGVTTTIERPATFPAKFPLPPGTAITKQEPRSGNRMVIITAVPYDFQTTLAFLNQELPKAGFTPSGGESEAQREAESNYAGQGYKGRWVLHPVDKCPAVSELTVLAGPQ